MVIMIASFMTKVLDSEYFWLTNKVTDNQTPCSICYTDTFSIICIIKLSSAAIQCPTYLLCMWGSHRRSSLLSEVRKSFLLICKIIPYSKKCFIALLNTWWVKHISSIWKLRETIPTREYKLAFIISVRWGSSSMLL